MIDGFPACAPDPDHAMQRAIDAELRNARRLQQKFEQEFPADPQDQVKSFAMRLRRAPRVHELYPALVGAKDHHAWLLPLLRRLAWHDAYPDAGREVWKPMIARMIELVVDAVSELSEDEFVGLTDLAERWSLRYEKLMGGFVAPLERDGKLSDRVLEALTRLRRLADRNGDIETCRAIMWPVFRTPLNPHDPDPCWSAKVRRDLEQMEPQLRVRWSKVLQFDLDSGFYPSNIPGKLQQKALHALGDVALEAGLRRWTGMLREGPVLTRTGALVLRRVIVLCHLLGGRACDELLHDIACAPWGQKPEHSWMYVYLQVLSSRPQHRAFACLEALMMNPHTATPEVRRQYDALLTALGAGAEDDSDVGVDGFALDSDPELASQQRSIDGLLRMAAKAAEPGPYIDPQHTAMVEQCRSIQLEDLSPIEREVAKRRLETLTRPHPWFPVSPEVRAAHDALESGILKQFADDPGSLHRAVALRVEWIEAHREEFSKDAVQLWNDWLCGLGSCGGLVNRSLSKVDRVSTLDSLLRTIRTAPGHSKVLELTEKYVGEHGWTLELVEAFRAWIPTLGVAASTEADRARSEWLVWFEDVAPIDLEACWSHRVKRDLRAMKAKEAAGWRALLDNHTFAIPGRAPQKWLKTAKVVFPKLGAETFRRRFVTWFEPFAKGEPLRIRATGRNILRTLMWYALIAKDPVVDEALLGFANARWKTKQLAALAAKVEKAFSHVIAERMPETALPVLETYVANGQAPEGSAPHKIYLDLCSHWNRPPVRARVKSPKSGTGDAKHGLDGELIHEIRRLLVTQQLHDPSQ